MIWELVGDPTEKSLLQCLKKEMYKTMDYIIVKVYVCKDYLRHGKNSHDIARL